jgi:hypothetical protein
MIFYLDLGKCKWQFLRRHILVTLQSMFQTFIFVYEAAGKQGRVCYPLGPVL